MMRGLLGKLARVSGDNLARLPGDTLTGANVGGVAGAGLGAATTPEGTPEYKQHENIIGSALVGAALGGGAGLGVGSRRLVLAIARALKQQQPEMEDAVAYAHAQRLATLREEAERAARLRETGGM